MIAGQHQLQPGGMASLNNRIVFTDTFDPFLQLLFAHHQIQVDEISCFGRLIGNFSLKLGIAQVIPRLGGIGSAHKFGIIDNTVLAPVPDHPAILGVKEFAEFLKNFIRCRGRIFCHQILFQEHSQIENRHTDRVGQVATGGFFGKQSFRGVLRAHLRAFYFQPGVALFEKP